MVMHVHSIFKKWKQLRFIWVNHSSDLVCLLLVHQSFASTFRSFPLVDSLGEKQKEARCFFVYFFFVIGFLGFLLVSPVWYLSFVSNHIPSPARTGRTGGQKRLGAVGARP